MPLYIYACSDCEIEIEELRSSARADEPVACPICHGFCARAISTFSLGRGQPIYGEVTTSLPASLRGHSFGCGCCGPRRR